MHTRRTFVLSIATAAALCAGGSSIATASSEHHYAHAAGALAGTWSGSYSGAYSGTFTLKWRQSGSDLTGHIKLSNPNGSYICTGHVHNGSIRFGVVAAGASYKGTVSGSSMSGTYTTLHGGGSWSAHKTS